MKSLSESIAVLCIDAPATAEDRIMYMPGGLHSITPSQGGKPVVVNVKIDAGSAGALEEQRQAIVARGKRAFFDFNHEDRQASFWPSSFEWSDSPEPAVYCRGEWSAEGKSQVEGKGFRSFSPVFYVNDTKANPAEVVCQPKAKPNMGGLVNDPAFAAMDAFFAKDAEEEAPAPAVEAGSAELEKLREEKAALENEAAELRQQVAEAVELKARAEKLAEEKEAIELEASEMRSRLAIPPDHETLKARAAELEKQNEGLELEAREVREKNAESAIMAAIARGVIPPRDTELIAFWRGLLIGDPLKAKVLERQKTHPALGGRITPAAGSIVIPRVVGNAPKDLLAAYAAVQRKQIEASSMAEKVLISKDAAAIYAREIRGNNEMLDMPLQAANAPGTLSGTLISQRTLELLKFSFAALTSITADFSDMAASFGQTVKTRIVAIPSVQTYDPTTGWTQNDQDATDISVTISNHKGVNIVFDSNTLASTVRQLFNEFAPGAAYALAKDLIDALYALITTGNFPGAATVSQLADFDRSQLINLGVALNLRGVPMGADNRSLLLYSTYYGKLEEDTALSRLSAYGGNAMIATGVLPNVQGFKAIDAPNLPQNGANIVGFGFSKSALVAASRVPNDYTTILPGASFGNVMVIADPDLGISALQTQYVNHDKGSASQRIAWMYGVAPGQANAGQLLTSA